MIDESIEDASGSRLSQVSPSNAEAGTSRLEAADRRAERTVRIATLYDFYGVLLTAKQQDMIQLHFFDDWSLAEIASHMDVSRQAVHDNLRRAEEQLEHYEQALVLAKAHASQRQVLQQLFSAWDELASCVPLLERTRFEGLLMDLKSQLDM